MDEKNKDLLIFRTELNIYLQYKLDTVHRKSYPKGKTDRSDLIFDIFKSINKLGIHYKWLDGSLP